MKLTHLFLLSLATLFFAAEANAQFSFSNRTSWLHNPASFTSGVALAVTDINNDGKDDIIRLRDGYDLNVEYQQDSGQPFTHAYLGNAGGEAWALAVADANNDGFSDLFFGGYYDNAKFYKAINNGTGFQPGLLSGGTHFAQGSNFVDINNDGWLDIFSCHDHAESRIWGNDGTGNFAEADQWINMATVPASDNSGNYGSVWSDFDNDGDTDLYIAKCRGGVTNPADPRRINALFVNDGQGNFTEAAGDHGLKIDWQSWTADFQDIDNDGDFDCLITNHDYSIQLLENDGTGHFTDISASAGVSAFSGFLLQGIMRDFNNDGFVDIITASPGLLLRNNGNKTFTQLINAPFDGMSSLAVGDLNHDGFLDVYAAYACGIVNSCGVPDRLWINNGNGNHFLAVSLVGNQSNRKGVGARVELHGSWGKQVREVRAGESYGISNTLTSHFGLGSATAIDHVVVHWPSGVVDVLTNPAADQFLTIEEGSTNFCGTLAINATPPSQGLPDAMPTNLEGISCSNGMSLQLSLCNWGSGILPSNLPVAFYRNDPRLPGAILLNVEHTNLSLLPNDCQLVSFSINPAQLPDEASHQIFMVVNDDGTTPLPLAAHPASLTDECGYDNNFGSATLTHQAPALDLGSDLDLCNVDSVTLDAGSDFENFTWQDGTSSPIISATQSGVFWVNALDGCGFLRSDTVQVTLSHAAPIEFIDQSICQGESISLSVAGYTDVQWTPQPSLSCTDCASTTASPASTTTYAVSATVGACQSSDTIQVIVNTLPSVALDVQGGGCSLDASVTATGAGNGPFNYLWTDGQTTPIIYPEQTASYAVTVTDANGCDAADATQVVFHPFPALDAAATQPDCADAVTGAIDLTATNGTGPFSYLWSNQATTEDLTAIGEGNYTVTMTDANQCTAVADIAIIAPQALSIQATITPISCAGSTGSIALEVEGGTPDYSFLWSNDATSQNLTGLTADTYAVTLTDAHQCTATTTLELVEAEEISIQPTTTAIDCSTGTPGTISLAVSGGAGPYSYIWTNPAGADEGTTSTISTLQSGTYSATVTDAHGCTKTASSSMESTGQLQVDASQTPISCHPANGNDADGAISLAVTSGFPPFVFAWQNGVTDAQLTDLGEGTYSVTVTDSAGCIGSMDFVLTTPDALDMSATATAVHCFGEMSGTATVMVNGGTLPYSYTWDDLQTTATATNLATGQYSVSIQDAHGCTATGSAFVDSPTEVAVTASPLTTPCTGGATAQATASGGTPPYSFLWSDGQVGDMAQALADGAYTVTATDDAGCTGVASLTVAAPPTDSTAITIDLCQGDASPLTGIGYFDEGEFSESLVFQNQYGCDSTIHAQVLVHQQWFLHGWATVPYGYVVNGMALTMSIEICTTDTTEFGCVNISCIEYYVGPNATTDIAQQVNMKLFPNPFSDGFTLSFELPSSGVVNAVLFDALGRRVDARLENKTLGAGTHTFRFDNAAWPSGVYWLEFQVDGQGIRKQLIKQ